MLQSNVQVLMYPHSKRRSRSATTRVIVVIILLVCSSLIFIGNPHQTKVFQEYVAAVWMDTTDTKIYDTNSTNPVKQPAQDQGHQRSTDFPKSKRSDGAHRFSFDEQQAMATASSFQYLSRQNISRSLCGKIPSHSAPAVGGGDGGAPFPRIVTATTPTSTTGDDKGLDTQQQHRPHQCRPNAIVYVVQKGKHSSYERNSTALFIKSLDLLYRNYLSNQSHSDNTDVLIFHSGDYTLEDLQYLSRRYHDTVQFKLIDLSDTDYWTIPESVRYDNVSGWAAYPRFSIGYRHMIRWYALKLYDFIRDYAAKPNGCSYQYIMRMDEDSFLHSPIDYDLFHFMESRNYSYAFRMCSYELDASAWTDYVDHVNYCDTTSTSSTSSLPSNIPHRKLHGGLCAFYNNFFIVHTPFMWEPQVQHFLQWTDATGIMYQERYNDLQIQTIVVYAFLPAARIHRFLDWTYEHITYGNLSRKLPCPMIGSLQAGYLDPNVSAVFTQFAEESRIKTLRCPGIRMRSVFREDSMSPTYSHLPPPLWWNETLGFSRNEFEWRTIAAGSVERPNRGIASG